MALPVFQAAGAVVEGTTGTISPAWPAHQAGDIGLLITNTLDFHSSNYTNRHFFFTDSQGFEEVRVSPQQGGQGNFDPIPRTVNGDSAELRVFWKRATSSAEGAPVIGDSGDHTRAVIVTFRGCAPSGHPIHKAAGRSSSNAESSVPIPGFTTTDAECLIADIITSYGASFSGWSNASLGSLTERLDSSGAVGFGGSFALATGTKAVAGAVGVTNVSPSGSVHCGAIKLALTPIDSQPVPKSPHLINIGDRVSSTSGNITIPWPTHVAGNVGILVVESPGWPVVLGTPAGFVEMANSPIRAGTQGGSNSTSLNVYWCRATSAAMASPVANFVSGRISGFIMTFDRCLAAGNPYEASISDSSSGTANVNIPGTTIAKPDSRIVAIATSPGSDNNAKYIGEANPNLEACVAIANIADSSGGGIHIGVFTGRRLSVGNYGTTTANALNTTGQQAHFSFSMPPTSNDFVASRGLFTTDGQPAGVYYNRAIIADLGSFAATPQDAPLLVVNGYAILAETESFVTTTFSAEMRKILSRDWQREDPLDTSAWVREAPLFPDVLPAQQAPISFEPFVPAPPTEVQNYELLANTGVFTSVGQEMVFGWPSRVFPIATGAFATSGQSATLSKSVFTLAADRGLFATTGIAATLVELLWMANHEVGNLTEWYIGPGGGGGEFNGINGNTAGNGLVPTVDPDGSRSEASNAVGGRRGNWAAKLSITGSGGVRLFRWEEPINNVELYYSVWYYFPQLYTIGSGGFTNMLQWKSEAPGKNDPFFLVQWKRSGSAMYPSLYWWQPASMEGPQAGQFGPREWNFPSNTFPIGQWFNIEARYRSAGDFTGAIQLWMNGTELVNVPNAKTRYADGNTTWAVTNYCELITPSPCVTYIDDAMISLSRIGP